MIRVQEADFDVGGELARLTTDGTEAGGVCAFIGLVRDFASAEALDALEIEHYPRMTTRALERIEATAQARWPGVETLDKSGRPVTLAKAGYDHFMPRA